MIFTPVTKTVVRVVAEWVFLEEVGKVSISVQIDAPEIVCAKQTGPFLLMNSATQYMQQRKSFFDTGDLTWKIETK